jgi:CHAD domain-containing protein
MAQAIVDTRRSPSLERVHKLRVSVRRIQTVLWLFKGDPDLSRFRRLSRTQRELSKRLGEVREMDIAIQDGEEYHLNCRKLKIRRRSSRLSLQKYLSASRREELMDELIRLQTQIRVHRTFSHASRFRKLNTQLSFWMNFSFDDQTDIHRFRRALKRMRYVLEAMGQSVDALKALQDLLGRANDLKVLQELCGKKAGIFDHEIQLRQKVKRMKNQVLRTTKDVLADVEAQLA